MVSQAVAPVVTAGAEPGVGAGSDGTRYCPSGCVASRDVSLCASMEEVSKDRNWLLELLVLSDAKGGKTSNSFFTLAAT